MNFISAGWLIVWTCLGGWEIFENDILEYDCMGGSLESDCKDKSNVNFFNDKIESVESYCRLMIGCM